MATERVRAYRVGSAAGNLAGELLAQRAPVQGGPGAVGPPRLRELGQGAARAVPLGDLGVQPAFVMGQRVGVSVANFAAPSAAVGLAAAGRRAGYSSEAALNVDTTSDAASSISRHSWASSGWRRSRWRLCGALRMPLLSGPATPRRRDRAVDLAGTVQVANAVMEAGMPRR